MGFVHHDCDGLSQEEKLTMGEGESLARQTAWEVFLKNTTYMQTRGHTESRKADSVRTQGAWHSAGTEGRLVWMITAKREKW